MLPVSRSSSCMSFAPNPAFARGFFSATSDASSASSSVDSSLSCPLDEEPKAAMRREKVSPLLMRS